jgi:O-antigen ligase
LRGYFNWTEKALRFLLLGFAFFIPISIALSEACAYAGLAVWLLHIFSRREFSWTRCSYFWPILLFAGLAIWSAFRGLHPEVCFDKVDRLALFTIIFMITTAFGGDEHPLWRRRSDLVLSFVLGITLRGLYDTVRVPVEVLFQGVPLFDAGNMRDPQMYLVGICFLVAIWLAGVVPIRRHLWILATALNVLGLILHFKRGAWFSCVLIVVLMSLLTGRKKALWVLLLGVVLIALVPKVQERLGMMSSEWSRMAGGRYALWTQVAPALLTEHPLGIGYAGTTSEDFEGYGVRIQDGLNHVHNNILQIAVEMGPLGLMIWLVWMGIAFWTMLKPTLQNRRHPDWVLLGAWGGFCGLLFDGMVEYNFGDTEIMMLMCFLMGLSCLPRRVAKASDQLSVNSDQ